MRMEELALSSGGEATTSALSRLKGFSIELLDLLRCPKKVAPFLPEMVDFLHRAPPNALQPCLDFTLFPLLLLLDAAVQCRAEKTLDSSEGLGLIGRTGLVISDKVAEAMLMCIEELFKKCHLVSVNQMTVVMKKLTSAASLSSSEAAEEFRIGVLRCLQAMFLGLKPCSIASCSHNKSSSHWALSTDILQYLQLDAEQDSSEKGECLVAFLQSQDASAAVGHMLSLLFQAAELEVARGQVGSGRLRKEAFVTLRVLVAKVGTADALAYFLPGIVSRFGKALHQSRSAITGAAGNTGSIEHVVRGFTDFLIIVLSDNANLDGLGMCVDENSESLKGESKSAHDVLEVLRNLPCGSQVQSENLSGKPAKQSDMAHSFQNVSPRDLSSDRAFYVVRTMDWIDKASANADKILSVILPQFCVHPAERVRNALVDGIKGLLTYCSWTMKRSKFMLVEYLCVLVCDDSDGVAASALRSLELLFNLSDKFMTEDEISEIFRRIMGKLPRAILGSDETVALLHARQLLALIYCAGPDRVVVHLLSPPVKTASLLDMLGLSFSYHSQFSGSVDKLVSSNPLSVGYLLSIAELKAGSLSGFASADRPRISLVQNCDIHDSSAIVDVDSLFPRMPPWFIHVGSQRLYDSYAGILRLVGLSVMKASRSEVSLPTLIDIPLNHVKKLVKECRNMEYTKEGWQTWYRSSSGQLLREASAAVCILNEIIYGMSDQPVKVCYKFFRRNDVYVKEELCGKGLSYESEKLDESKYSKMAWKVCPKEDTRNHIINCIGSILRDYLSPEVWNMSTDKEILMLDPEKEEAIPLQFFRDVVMLHQVIIEGIAIFSIVLGKEFERCGFMHSSLYLLLQNLISSNSQIKTASDDVLRVLATTSGHVTVGCLVVANADYIIDSLCRELRHLDLNPHVPDVLSSMLSYIGAARDILPFLEEPMQAVSLELEVLGRNQHPDLTAAFLKALREITKASRVEASGLPGEAGSFCGHLPSRASSDVAHHAANVYSLVPGENDRGDAEVQIQHLEELLLKLNDMKRYRRIVGSLVASCSKSAIPLLASSGDLACLLSLDIVEDVLISLSKVEEAYNIEKETKMAIERAIQSFHSDDPEDIMDCTDEDADENRLLPAINKIWPFLILCLKNRVTVAVVRRCTSVLGTTVRLGGGDFFIRRFLTDGPVIWKMLASSPFHRKPASPKENDERRIVLPYRNHSLSSSEGPMAESSSLKVQEAILNMIADIAGNKRSASAMHSVLKKVSGLVVGIACSNVKALRDASLGALSGLARIDPDLIWLLLADVYYAVKGEEAPTPPTPDLSAITELLPSPSSLKDCLYVRYGGVSGGFDMDPSAVEMVFQWMQKQVLG